MIIFIFRSMSMFMIISMPILYMKKTKIDPAPAPRICTAKRPACLMFFLSSSGSKIPPPNIY